MINQYDSIGYQPSIFCKGKAYDNFAKQIAAAFSDPKYLHSYL